MNFSNLEDYLRYEGGLSRRLFLSYTAALSAVPFLGTGCASNRVKANFENNPFTLGVASGDPDSDGMVLWTKLAPKPLQLDSGMPIEGYVDVSWEIANDEEFKNIIKSGTAQASSSLGYSVHVEAEGLKSDNWYFYRFHCGNYTSRVGQTRTMPQANADVQKLKFAMTSCQHYESGLYTAYEQMAADNVDLVFHLGDYIYEYAGKDGRVRKHIGKEIETLAEYRQRYAQYRLDKHLQMMHAKCPWLVTWDDHEFDNNWADEVSEKKGVDKAAFLLRRAAAFQAYYEMMPLRKTSIPSGIYMQLYRQSSFGNLANFYVLDTRQYRTDQPNGDGKDPINAEALNPKNTLLGKAQKSWLFNSLTKSRTVWNVLAQQVMMGMVNTQRNKDKGAVYSMDQWPGYATERMEVVRFMAEHKISNPVVLTGDIHCNWANELRVNDLKQEDSVVASEFVTTSLSSGGNGAQSTKVADTYKSNNPCVKFYNAERGYVLCELSQKTWVSHYKVIDEVRKPGGKTTIRESYAVEAGSPKIHKA